ncbi:MAG TPA: hypothetical protein VFQ05_06435 [Candidatus Eisenbacteria bacterium]|nr:hypothetical protein [Candidatus Eisenbacteria bacterium]
MRKAAGFTLLGALLLSVPALSPANAGTFFIRASAGFASQSLEDWNDQIDGVNEVFQSGGIPAPFDNFGGAIPFGIEAGYQPNPLLALSVGVFRQSDQADNTYSDASGLFTLDSELALTSVTGAVSYWLPNTEGVFMGADVGMGFGTAKQNFVFRDFSDPANDLDVIGDWSGNGLVAGVFVGYQYQVPSGFLLHGRVGYQFQNLGEFDGDLTSPQLGSGSSPPVDFLITGQEMDTDFSGIQLLVGIGFAFGGP